MAEKKKEIEETIEVDVHDLQNEENYIDEDSPEGDEVELEYFIDKNELEKDSLGRVIPSIRLSKINGRSCLNKPNFLGTEVTTVLPLVVDDIHFEEEYEENHPIKNFSIKEIVKILSTKESGFVRYAPKLEVDKKSTSKETSLWVKPGGAVFCYTKSNDKTANHLIVNLLEIRLGHKTKPFERSPPDRKKFPPAPELSFSLIFPNRSVDIIAPSKELFQIWVHGLEKLAIFWKSEPTMVRELRSHWAEGKKDKLKYSELVKIIKKMNLSESNTKFLLKKQIGYTKDMAPVNFHQFAKKIEENIWVYFHVKQLFDEHSFDKKVLTLEEFTRFLHNTQDESKEKYRPEVVQDIITVLCDNPKANSLNIIQFNQFMTSHYNRVMTLDALNIYQDMTQPLQHYFINSSHNTYCSTDQLIGDSHVDMYRRVLKKGVRCVELDCWNGDKGEPIIYHGGTMVSKIYVLDVCQVIKDYAFVSSTYPVVLSIENHCNVEQQDRMADIMIDIFGDMIEASPEDSHVSYPPKSPEDLQRKILLKGRVESSKLSKLIFMRSIKYPSSKDKVQWYNVSSLTESALKKKKQKSLLQLNKQMFTRIYPAGDRISSSNYNPDHSWLAGSQLVALNLQSYDNSTMKNNSKFKDNGGSGYILKPISMRDESKTTKTGQSPMTLKVKLLGGRNFPKIKGHPHSVYPFAKISVPGCKEYTSKAVSGNGLNPTWDEKQYIFNIKEPSSASLVITFYDKVTSSVSIKPKSKKGMIGAGIGGLVGVGAATTAVIVTGGAAAPLIALGVGAGAAAVGVGVGAAASNSLTASRLGKFVIPVTAIRNGYRILELSDNKGNCKPLFDVLCHFET